MKTSISKEHNRENHCISENRNGAGPTSQFVDNRQAAIDQKEMQEYINTSSEPIPEASGVLQAKLLYGKHFKDNHLTQSGTYTDQQAALRSFYRGKRNTILNQTTISEGVVTSSPDKTKSDPAYTISKLVTVPSITANPTGGNDYSISKFKKVHLEGFTDGGNNKLTHLNGTQEADGGTTTLTVNFNDPAQLKRRAKTIIVAAIKASKGYIDPVQIKGSQTAITALATEMNKYSVNITELAYSAQLTGITEKTALLKEIAGEIADIAVEYLDRADKIVSGTYRAYTSKLEEIQEEIPDYTQTKEDISIDNLWDADQLGTLIDVTVKVDGALKYTVETEDSNTAITELKELIGTIREEYAKLPDTVKEEDVD